MLLAGGLLLQGPAGTPGGAELPSGVLAPDKQKHIWDLEHASFVIETYFGKSFVRALRERDRERLLAALLPDFQGEILVSSASERTAGELVSELRWDAATGKLQTVDAKGLVVAPGVLDIHTHVSTASPERPGPRNLNADRLHAHVPRIPGDPQLNPRHRTLCLDATRGGPTGEPHAGPHPRPPPGSRPAGADARPPHTPSPSPAPATPSTAPSATSPA